MLIASNQTSIRSSSTNLYPECSRMWAAKSIPQEIRRAGYHDLRTLVQGIGATLGTVLHGQAQFETSHKMKTGELAPEADSMDMLRDGLREGVRQGVEFDRHTTQNINVAETQAGRMHRVWRTHIAPALDPVAVETRLDAQISVELVLTGQPDVVCGEPGRLRDLKTGRHEPNARPQLGCYSMLCRTYGHPITEVVIDWIPRVPIGKPQPRPISYRHDLAETETLDMAIIRHIQHDLHVFRHGGEGIGPGDAAAFVPNPSCRLCSPKYCPAHGTSFCREGRKS